MLSWLTNTARGACMGIADAIPGVSGGTIALILGIYERFIAAISAVGWGMIRAVFSRELWRRLGKGLAKPGAEGDDKVGQYAAHILFLGSLVVGIGGALVIGARFIPDLLRDYPGPMNGFFMGLVVASVVIPYRMMKKRGAPQVAASILAAVATFILVGLPIDQSNKARGEVTVELVAAQSEAIALSADRESTVFMTARHGGTDKKREVAFLPERPITIPAGQTHATIPVVARLAGGIANVDAGALTAAEGLPVGTRIVQAAPMTGGADPALWFVFIAGVIAISAMVLPGISGSFILLMLGLYNYVFFNVRAAIYDQDGAALVILAVFAAALVLGILTFARVVKWLLDHHRDVTLAALTGMMVGSVRKLWPFQETLADGTRSPSLPAEIDGTFATILAAFVVGIVIVVALEAIGRKKAGPVEASA